MAASLTGFAISLIISLVVTAGLLVKAPPVIALERAGIEQGMRLAWAFSPFFDLDHASDDGPSFVFLDGDVAGCEHYRPNEKATCLVRNPVTATFAAEAIRWARASGAAGIILDTAPFDDPADRDKVRQAALEPGSWIIAPLAGRGDVKDGQAVFNHDPANDLIPTPAEGPLRLAVFEAVMGDAADDGIARGYRDAAPVRSPGVEGATWRAPTVAFLAAELFDPHRRSAIDCKAYRVGCQPKGAKDHTVGEAHKEAEAGDLPRIAFSLPSLSIDRPERQRDRLEARYEPIITRLVASQLLKAGGGRLPPEAESVRGRIVVIGSSAQTAHDWVYTPIGLMAGSELLINATRDFAARAHDASHHQSGRAGPLLIGLLDKTIAAARGALIMIFAWIAILKIQQVAQGRRGAAKGLADLGSALAFVVGLGIVGLIEIYFLMHHIQEGFGKGHFVDVLTPILALGLEGYSEAGKTAVTRFERLFLRLLPAGQSPHS